MSFLTRGISIQPPKRTWTLFVLKPGWRRRLSGYSWVMFDEQGMTGVGKSREELREAMASITTGVPFKPYHPEDQAQARVIADEIMDL